MGRLEQAIEAYSSPEEKCVRYGYNSFGMKDKEYKADGSYIAYEYDGKGRLKHTYASDQSVSYSYTYDAADRPLSVRNDITGLETTRTYDGLGNLLEETLESGIKLRYQYDLMGRVIGLTLPDETGIAYRYSPVALKEIARRIDEQDSYVHRIAQRDLSGRIQSVELALPTSNSVDYTHDICGRLVSISHAVFHETVPDGGYDAVGNLLTLDITDPLGTVRCSYAYDAWYQLTSESGIRQHRYVNDSLYNRLEKDGATYTVNSLNSVLSDSKRSFRYDINGNRTEMDSNGNAATYTYDALDRLICYTNSTYKYEYSYDAFNRRTAKRIYDLSDSSQPIDTEYYLYQGQNEIGMVDTSGTMRQFRLLGEGVGAEIGASIAIELDHHLYVPLNDHRGNIVALLDGTIGNVVESYRYSAFGEEEIYDSTGEKLDNSALSNPWRFSSKRVDLETGLVYFGRRYYDPSLGKWLTLDPIGHEGGPNLYAYVNNSPLTHWDLYGLIAESDRGWFSSIRDRFDSFWSRTRDVFSRTASAIGSGIRSTLRGVFSTIDAVVWNGPHLGGLNRKISNVIRCELGLDRRPSGHSCIRNIAPPETPDSNIYIEINGVNTTLLEATENAKYFNKIVQRKDPGAGVILVYNGSHGLFNDLLEALVNILGFTTNAVKKTKKCLQQVAATKISNNSRGKGIPFSHSQGGAIHNIAYNSLTPEEKEYIAAGVTTGSASLFDEADAHLIDISDWIPFFCNPVKYIKSLFFKNKRIKRIGRFPRNPFKAHDFLSPYNLEAIEKVMEIYCPDPSVH